MIRHLALVATCCSVLAAFAACGSDDEGPGDSPGFDTGSGSFDAGSGGGFDVGSGGDAGAEPCTPGDMRPADDGCNTCTCMDDGVWACTEMACVGECLTDDDCVVSGCSGQLCGAEPMDSDCAWYDEYACYQDEAITTCGCNNGVCGWAQTDALDACLSDPPCTPGSERPADDGCNSCLCMEDGTWACTLLACLECSPGDTIDADNGCDCVCDDTGSWDCELLDVNGDFCDPTAACEPGTSVDIDACNSCVCMDDGTWACTGVACIECTPGDSIIAEDGCDCFCDATGTWDCDEFDVDGNRCDGVELCTPGETTPAPDGCNTCTCTDDGQGWACTEMACGGGCVTDADCIVTGCSGQICADTEVATTCEWLPWYACFSDPDVTSCGCNDGVCGWAESEELDACLGG